MEEITKIREEGRDIWVLSYKGKTLSVSFESCVEKIRDGYETYLHQEPAEYSYSIHIIAMYDEVADMEYDYNVVAHDQIHHFIMQNYEFDESECID